MIEFAEGDVVAKIGDSEKWMIEGFTYGFAWLESLDDGRIMNVERNHFEETWIVLERKDERV